MPKGRTCRVQQILLGRTRTVTIHTHKHEENPQIYSRAAVRSKQVLGCVQCNVRPSIKGKLCAVCNSERQSRLEPRLEELDPRGKSFEHCGFVIVQMCIADTYWMMGQSPQPLIPCGSPDLAASRWQRCSRLSIPKPPKIDMRLRGQHRNILVMLVDL
jgi:hypothetical protein